MLKIKKYACVLDDGKNVFKTYIPATSKRDLQREWAGNGEFVSIKELPDLLCSSNRVADDLRSIGYGEAECQFIERLLSRYLVGTV